MSQENDFVSFLEANFSKEIDLNTGNLDSNSAFWDELRKKLSAIIEDLLERDHTKLMDILYRIDIPDHHVNQALSLGLPFKISEELCERIIERQIKKFNYRKQFSKDSKSNK